MGHSNRCKHDRVCCRTRLRHCEWWCPNGIDVAKAIALGACAGGLAKPFLKTTDGPDAVIERVGDLIAELRTAMFVTGSGSIDELQQVEYVLHGETREYVEQRTSSE